MDKLRAITIRTTKRSWNHATQTMVQSCDAPRRLGEGKPLDASEFAVHLDQVRDGRANADYQNPVRFFERTLLTTNLRGLAAEACAA